MSHAALIFPDSNRVPLPSRSRTDDRALSTQRRSSRVSARHAELALHGVAASRVNVARLLVVTEDVTRFAHLRTLFESLGREVLHASKVSSVLSHIESAEIDAVITDQQFSDGDGLRLLDALQRQYPNTITAMLSAPGNPYSAAEAFAHGATDVLRTSGDRHELIAFLARAESLRALANAEAAPEPVTSSHFHGMYGSSAALRETVRLIRRVAPTDVTVLVTGESGTGKELVARALHEESARRHQPFVALNCSALPAELVESELFGHTRGAFTGAVKDRGGLFEAAHGGTLFLDEIGDLGPLAQAKVLRALESGEVMRVGATRCTHVDVRVIAATHRPLDEMVAQGKFREDLLYRLKVIPLALPPLRDRVSDIPQLLEHFVQFFSQRHGVAIRAFDATAEAALLAYAWPGNVRELRNVIEGALVMADGAMITVADFPASVTQHSVTDISDEHSEDAQQQLIDATDLPFVEARERALRAFDRAFLTAALARNGGNIARTARALGLHRQSLQKLLVRRELRASNEGRDATL